MKSMSRKALRLASEYSNRQYKVSRETANELGIASSCTDSSDQLELMPEDISNEHI